jgi:hypothetical protein
MIGNTGHSSETMDSDIPGKYINEKNGSQYLELKPDGNCFLFTGSAGVTGTYEVDAGEITLFTGGSTSKGSIQDGVIIDEEGDRWVLAKAAGQASTQSPKCPKCNSDVLENAKFCSNCGAVMGAPAGSARQVTPPATGDEKLASIPWLAKLAGKNLPWELYEAIGWVAVLILLLVG